MTRLLDRDMVLTVGTTRISMRSPGDGLEPRAVLKVVFKVEKTLTSEPNNCEISIHNLSEETRKKIFETRRVPVLLECGYVGLRHQIFLGDLGFARSRREGTDWVTSLQSHDGANAIQSARVNTSLKGSVDAGSLLRAVGESFGLDVGNLQQKVAEGGLRSVFKTLTQGAVLSGKSKDVMDRLTKSSGYTWSAQDGKLQILGPEETNANEVPLLTPTSGLVGTPEPAEEGKITIRSLIVPNLQPGNRVRVESESVRAFFKITKTVYTGDTWGQEWYATMDCRPIG